jgi:hypothetical protein
MMNPAQVIIGESDKPLAAVDSKGRRLLFRRLTALDTLRLLKAAGPVLSQNEPWLSMAGLGFSVREIDGVPVPTPTTEAQIEGLIDRLGDEGLAAVANVMEDDSTPSPTRADVGNLHGTLS